MDPGRTLSLQNSSQWSIYVEKVAQKRKSNLEIRSEAENVWLQNNVQEKNREEVGLVFNETWAFRTVPSIPLSHSFR